MRAIEDTTTAALLEEASRQLLEERKHHAVALIKNALNTVGKLSNDLGTMERQMAKKKEELEKMNRFLDQLREGRWEVLSEFKPEKEEQGE